MQKYEVRNPQNFVVIKTVMERYSNNPPKFYWYIPQPPNLGLDINFGLLAGNTFKINLLRNSERYWPG